MVWAHGNMEPVPNKSTERLVSSPIGIPSSKVRVYNRTNNNIVETSPTSSHSPIGSPGNYGPLRNLSASAPNRGSSNHHVSKVLHDGQHDSDESNGEILDRLPDCSPAFSTVFSELLKLESKKRDKENEVVDHSNPEQSQLAHEEQKKSPESTPTLLRREMKILRFDLPEMRPRASSHSVGRKPLKKELPLSAHSTPSLNRRTKHRNTVNTKPVNPVPKFKFLTETITVSHEDIVKEHELQDKLHNGYPSPKSIFGVLEERASPTY